MNRSQWLVLGIGLILESLYLSSVVFLLENKYDWFILSSILFTLGILFIICGFLEPKKEKDLK